MDFNVIINKMIRAAKLEPALYEEVERDTNATQEALMVIILVGLASGISSMIGSLMAGNGPIAAILGLIVGVVMGVIMWVIWAYLTYWIGTSLMGGTSTPGEMLRCLGFANSPNVLAIFGFIPCVGGLVALAASIWALVAGVVGVRQAMDFDTGKAVITVIIGWVVIMVITAILGLLGFGLAAATGALG